MVIPVGIKDEHQIIVVLGINPCRPFNNTYIDYVKLLQATMSTGLTTVTVSYHPRLFETSYSSCL